jgi:5'-nucleotidase
VPGRTWAQPEELSSPRRAAPLTILQINDVYSMLPVNGAGGLARVASIKKEFAAEGRTPLLMIAGDFLGGSVASTVFKGEQMIAALNAAGLDFATLGNHEFDFGIDTLLARMSEAKFRWVVSNVVDRQTGRPVGGAAPYAIRTAGPLKVGILGLCIRSEGILPTTLERLDFVDPDEAVARYLPDLEREGANVVVLLTHLRYQEDRELADRFPQIDVIVGGHEHYPLTGVWGQTLVSKAGSDARFVARIDLDKRGTNRVDRYFELIPVTGAVKDDPATLDVVNRWEAKLGPALDHVLGTISAPLDARDRVLRLGETALGDFIADTIRDRAGADIAIMNSGGIRGNRVYPAGPITQRLLLEMHPFGNVICKIAVTGRVLLQALENGVTQLPDYANAGKFPQISGFTMRVDLSRPPGSRVRDVRIGNAPLDPNRTYTLALPNFVLEGGDGYTMFAGSRVLIDRENGTPIQEALEEAVSGRNIAPRVEGRIVTTP